MEKEQDFKDLEAFKLLKLQESVTYFYKSWAKIENPVKKETLVSLMVESTVTTYVIATKSIETVTQKDITELDFNKIAKAIPLKLENLVQMYELLLGKKVKHL